MAKAKLSSHSFFTLVVLSVTALSVMLFTYASQQKTNTQSDAAGTCVSTKAPILRALDTTKGNNYVVYKYEITNPCSGKYSYGFHMGAPGSWYIEYRENLGEWESEYSSPFLSGTLPAKSDGKFGKVTVRARVFPSDSALNKTYKFQAKACNAFGLGDAPALGSYCDYSAVSYTVTGN